jgi:Dolichyl-phosphate-mannose-protein mannosyltransferase
MDRRRLVALLILAVLVTFLNSLKPLHMDDADYYTYATQIARTPLDPYGFEVKEGVPANHYLVPPVLPYWLAIATKLFGDHLVLWKWWLLPFALLFVASLYGAIERFAPGLELPLVCMTALSPAFLPSWNLMLDLPALAISLCGLATFFRACDKQSVWLGALAGLLFGIAAQTKYTAFVAPAVAIVYAFLFRRPRLGLLTAALGAAVFVGWECFVAAKYGESHFIYSLQQRGSGFWTRVARLLLPLIGVLGGVAPGLAMLGLLSLGVRRRFIGFLAFAMCLGYMALALVPDRYSVLLRDAGGRERLTLSNVIFGVCGLVVCTIVGIAAWRLCRRKRDCQAGGAIARADLFLILWLTLELAGYLVLSPFPATRRLVGLLVVATIVAGRLASKSCVSRPRIRLARWLAVGTAALGLCYFAIDLRDAQAQRKVAQTAALRIRGEDPAARIWCYGAWGFKHYARAAGMLPIASDPSKVQAGDWLVVGYQPFEPWPGMDGFAPVTEVAAKDRLPVRMMPCYYGGRTGFEHCDGPRFWSVIYRFQ